VKLKTALTTAPLLRNPRCGQNEEFYISTDASKYAVGAVLLQKDANGHMQPCAYYSKVFQSNQTHYPAYQQELLGIVLAVQEWRHYIEGARKITCITDHATLRHLVATENVNALTARRFALWSDIIAPFIGINDKGESTFEILYRKGSENDSDALSRRPDLHHEIVTYDKLVQEKELEIANDFFSSMYHMHVDREFVHKIVSSYPLDSTYGGVSIPRGTHLNDSDGLYYFGDKVCIPNDKSLINSLIREAHDAQGHPSMERTLANLSKTFWWPRMSKTVKHYCKLCATCQRIKARTTKPPGTLYPLPKASRPWDTMSMDFISGLPIADGYDSIATFVDTFTKQAHFVPCTSKINAEELSRIYFNHIFKLHGLSRCIISDRDPLFTSIFWKDLMRQLRTKLNMSSAYHPQTDGQTERTHRTIEQILRGFVHAQHHDWLHALPLAEFCYNNSVHSATKFSPFEALYGFNPLTPPDLIASSNTTTNIAQRIRDIHELIAEELKNSDVYMQHDAAKKSNAAITFNEGDKVWLSTEHLKLHNQPSRKFQQRYIGPYSIISKISEVAYEIDLPNTMNCHNVFHISKLRPCTTVDVQPDYIPVQVEKERQDFIVDSIVDHDIATARDGFYERGPCLVFKVHWAGYTSSDDTWQTYQSIRRVKALDDYARDCTSFQKLYTSKRYAELHKKYPQRFPIFDT
jgi:transposase InsO family protein